MYRQSVIGYSLLGDDGFHVLKDLSSLLNEARVDYYLKCQVNSQHAHTNAVRFVQGHYGLPERLRCDPSVLTEEMQTRLLYVPLYRFAVKLHTKYEVYIPRDNISYISLSYDGLSSNDRKTYSYLGRYFNQAPIDWKFVRGKEENVYTELLQIGTWQEIARALLVKLIRTNLLLKQ